jgi:hypothetical protein
VVGQFDPGSSIWGCPGLGVSSTVRIALVMSAPIAGILSVVLQEAPPPVLQQQNAETGIDPLPA